MGRFSGLSRAVGLAALVLLAAAPPALARGVTGETAPAVSAFLLQRGIDALNEGRSDEAIDFLEQSVVAYPRNARAFAYLGRAHGTAGRKERATKYFETALAIDPDDLKALQWAGEAALAAEDRETAERNLARIRRLCSGRCAEYRDLNRALGTQTPAGQ